MRASRALDHFLSDDIVSGESFGHPAADQGFNALIDFGHRIAPQCLLGRLTFVAYGYHAPERSLDFGTGQRCEFDRYPLNFPQLRNVDVFSGFGHFAIAF
jgi:hypothetical protein